MPSRLVKALTLGLLIASAFPPPKVFNFLIASSSDHQSTNAGKTVQARGRNRIGSPSHLNISQAIAPLASGEKRPPQTPRPFDRPVDPSHKHVYLAPASPAFPAILRFRC